jgi:transcriptional regulator with XRE-family HTH domain
MNWKEKINKFIEYKGITVYELSLKTGISQSTFSKILNDSVKKPNIKNAEILEKYFLENTFNGVELMKNAEYPTGYYYPDVSASAGLETEIINDELKRIPVNIPNWEKGIDFINVYGDSMYPKYCSGEIIGIKEVEPQYLNYGYAYVVIFNDSQVFLKYINPGSDNDHWILSSENPKHPPKEYHLSLIKKIFIIKGVITKTTM